MAFFLPFSGHALTSQTTANQIQGSPPYLTFDGGRTRGVNTNGLLGITLSDGTEYTPSTNPSSSTTPIVLPATGQSFADISMFVPTNTNSVALSTLIGPPNNYWGDDDGDSDVTVTGSLSLSIVDNNNQPVLRSAVLEVCKAPYRVELSSTDGTLSTRYGVPSSSTISANSVTYYVNPKPNSMQLVCFARPNLKYGKINEIGINNIPHDYLGPASIWNPDKGFLSQSTDPSLYGRNFPTTGANKLYFDLLISGVNQPLSWSPVSRGGIIATMSNSTATSVRVTLTGPYATTSQHNSSSPGRISKPTLPQTFELVGRDTNGTPVVKYGFTLKQWFVHRGSKKDSYSNTLPWCNRLGYRVPKLKDLTNSNYLGAIPSSSGRNYMRHIGAGFTAEWGRMSDYSYSGFVVNGFYWTNDPNNSGGTHVLFIDDGYPASSSDSFGVPKYGLCVYP